jgi:hypothetical protein
LGNTWTLASASDGGAPVEVPQHREIQWRFLGDGDCGAISLPCPDGQKLVGNDVCNDFVLSLHVDADRIVWGDEGATTAASCPGGLTDTLDDYFQDDFSRYLVARDQLRLTSSDGTIELTFRESDGE